MIPIVTGIDHIYISVSDMKRSEEFYDTVMRILNFCKNEFSIENDRHVQYYCRDFGFVLRPCHDLTSHNPYSPGLHHLCFRVPTREDVYETAREFDLSGIAITRPDNYPEYAPDYYAFTFNDPDGIRLEITNYRKERQERHDNWENSNQ